LVVNGELVRGGFGREITVRHVVAAPGKSVHGLDSLTFVAGKEKERVVKV
jgi:hypothetical protein